MFFRSLITKIRVPKFRDSDKGSSQRVKTTPKQTKNKKSQEMCKKIKKLFFQLHAPNSIQGVIGKQKSLDLYPSGGETTPIPFYID